MAKKMTKPQAKKKVSGAKKKVEAALGRLYRITGECSLAGHNLATRGSSSAGAALGSWNYSVEPYSGAACKRNAKARKPGTRKPGTSLLSKAKRVARAKKAAKARWKKK